MCAAIDFISLLVIPTVETDLPIYDSVIMEKGGDTLMKCIIVVRNNGNAKRSDEFLKALDWIYYSPIIEIDPSDSIINQIEMFDEKHRQYYSDYLYPTFQIVRV